MSLKIKFKNFLKSTKLGKNIYNLLFYSKIINFIRYKAYLSDEKYIEQQYYKKFHKIINLDEPSNFNEKNNWRKLNDRKDIYTLMVDKYEIKGIIKERLGEKYTFPLLGVWNNVNDINFEDLPDKFVLKTNHSGGVIVCRDKSTFDITEAKKELNNNLKINYFLMSREWPYKNVVRKIICEKYMGENLTDYKIYCFNGVPTYTFVWENQSRVDGRKPEAYFCGAYDYDWKKTDLEIDYPSLNKNIEKPSCYNELIKVATAMSKDIPFVRVDCYVIDNNVYVGETTFFPWGGWQKFKNEKWNEKLGKLEKLPYEQ